MCMLHTKEQEPVGLYLLSEVFSKFLDSLFLILPRGIRGISTFIINCISCHFFIIT